MSVRLSPLSRSGSGHQRCYRCFSTRETLVTFMITFIRQTAEGHTEQTIYREVKYTKIHIITQFTSFHFNLWKTVDRTQLNNMFNTYLQTIVFKNVSRITLGCQHKFMAPRPKTVLMSIAFRQNTTKNVIVVL